jgi:hypothetical protein
MAEHVSETSLRRFRMFTRTTKRLTLRTQADPVTNSSVLRSYALKTTLLPRLVSLSMDAQAYPNCELDWIPALFCSSILEIKIIPQSVDLLSSMTHTICAEWLDAIAAICPELHTLCVYPYSPRVQWDESAPAGVQEAEEAIQDRFRIQLAKLTHLRHVSINPCMSMREDMVTLGGFPHLECLEIHGSHQPGTCAFVSNLAQSCFPKLQRLSLHHTSYSDLGYVLSRLNPLVRDLTTLDLIVDPRPVYHNRPLIYEKVAFMLYQNLSNKTYPLTRLAIRFDICPDDNLGTISQPDLRVLSRLPLEYVSFHKVHVYGWHNGDDPCRVLTDTWRNIAELHWPNQPANAQDLVHFSSLPNLRNLTLDLQLSPGSEIYYSILLKFLLWQRNISAPV